jgi:predicted transcriptional regulator
MCVHLKASNSDKVVGIITASDIIKALRTTDINPPLEDVMTRKVFNLEYNRAIIRAIRIMRDHRIGSIIIFNRNTNKSKIPYGIFTERDLLTKVLSRGIDLNEKVGDYSSTPLVTTQIGIRAIEAANLMYLNNMKRLVLTDPLSQDNNPVAIVTARDLVEAFQKKKNCMSKDDESAARTRQQVDNAICWLETRYFTGGKNKEASDRTYAKSAAGIRHFETKKS